MSERTPLERALTTLDGDCWIWTGIISSSGYPRIHIHEGLYVHRAVVEAQPGEHVHHVCGNRACVNPSHLEVLSSQAEHTARHRRTECVNGHPYTEENVYITPAGTRQCRTCKMHNNRKAAARA